MLGWDAQAARRLKVSERRGMGIDITITMGTGKWTGFGRLPPYHRHKSLFARSL
jgi:hypothetical protein